MIRLGDRIRAKPTIEGGSPSHASEGREMTGNVVYIHPEKRFYVLEFEAANGFRWKESFFYPRSRVYTSPGAKPGGWHRKK